VAALLLDQLRYQSSPTGLMTRSQSRPGVAMKKLMKQISVAIGFA
jgi:hypothetical protein